MVNPRIVKRYALALMKSSTLDNIEEIYQDILTIERTVGASKDLKVMMRSPVIEYHKKQAVMREVFASSVSAATLDFLMLLLEKSREIMLKDIIAAFKNLYNERHNIQSVRIASAVELDEPLKNSILSAIEAKTGKKTDANFSVNSALKGGVTITIGDVTYDGTIRRQLELLYKQMTGSDMTEQLRATVLGA